MTVAAVDAGARDLGPAPFGAVGKANEIDTLAAEESFDRDRLAGAGDPHQQVVADSVEADVCRIDVGQN